MPLDGTGIKSDAGTDYAAAAIDSTTGWRDGRGGNRKRKRAKRTERESEREKGALPCPGRAAAVRKLLAGWLAG